jgi:hypothetical protein
MYVNVNYDGISCGAADSTCFNISVAGQGSLGYKTINWDSSGLGTVKIGKGNSTIDLDGNVTANKIEVAGNNGGLKLANGGLDIRMDQASQAIHSLPLGPAFRLGNGALTYTTDNGISMSEGLAVNGDINLDRRIKFLTSETALISAETLTLQSGSTLKLDAGYINLDAAEIHASVPIDEGSDIRLKNIIRDLYPAIEDIAKVRIVDYTYKAYPDVVRAGSIAQDWEPVIPNSTRRDHEGYMTLDYGAASLISAVTAAREIVTLKEENRLLKERIERLERLIEER